MKDIHFNEITHKGDEVGGRFGTRKRLKKN